MARVRSGCTIVEHWRPASARTSCCGISAIRPSLPIIWATIRFPASSATARSQPGDGALLTDRPSIGALNMIKVGDRLPEGTLTEFIEVEGNGCTIGPNTFKVE